MWHRLSSLVSRPIQNELSKPMSARAWPLPSNEWFLALLSDRATRHGSQITIRGCDLKYSARGGISIRISSRPSPSLPPCGPVRLCCCQPQLVVCSDRLAVGMREPRLLLKFNLRDAVEDRVVAHQLELGADQLDHLLAKFGDIQGIVQQYSGAKI